MDQILKQENGVRLIYNKYMGYAVLIGCYNCTDRIQFWQQVSKWYFQKKRALDIFDKKVKENQ